MKYIGIFLLSIMMVMPSMAQTLRVRAGSVDYQFPASVAGEMEYLEGKTLKILGKDFVLNEVDSMTTRELSHNTVNIDYSSFIPAVNIATTQYAYDNMGYDNMTNRDVFSSSFGGVKVNFQMSGITHIELESVDALSLAGNSDKYSITFFAKDGGTLVPGQDYYITTFPAAVNGGYRLSIYRNGLVAHYFGVHQDIDAGSFISPVDLNESELEFDDPDAPLVEEERPELDSKTKELLRLYKQNPSDANYTALYEQMGVRYDKVVARKKAKLRELEREAHHQALIDEMQGIVDEMVINREERLWQRFLSLIDSRKDDNVDDSWCVLKGAWEENAYIGFTPVTNAEYAVFESNFSYPEGQGDYPVVNVSYEEAMNYCKWLATMDESHDYRLPSEYEWILAAGHMPKDVNMNSNFVESGLTSVNAYSQTVGNCGGIDFWGNCWEWTSTQNAEGEYLVKGGSWNSSRDQCRSEYSDDARSPSKGYANVGFRVVRVDK